MKKYFINAHTSEGFKSLLHQFWDDYDIWVVTGSSTKLRGLFLTELAKQFIDKKLPFHLFLHPTDGKTLEGILLYEKKLLIMADNSPMFLWSKYSGTFAKTINLNDCLNWSFIQKVMPQIRHLIDEIDQKRNESYMYFAQGKSIHEEKEKLSIKGIDFDKVDVVTNDVIDKWLNKEIDKRADRLVMKKVFFGGASKNGPINVIDDITEGMRHRIIFKGKSGSGKSTFMRKFAAAAESKELQVQYFPCALDPNSIDMIIIPALSLAIVDGTAPHIVEPSRVGDIVLDMYERCKALNTVLDDEKHLNDINKRYKETMKKGTECLQKSYKQEQMLEDLCNHALQPKRFNEFVKNTKSLF